MQVRFNTNSYSKPTFGMATLTKQGTEVAKQFMDEIPNLADGGGALVIKNLTPKFLRAIASEHGPEAGQFLEDFFKQGTGNFKINNEAFVRKQILPARSYRAIKNFLKWQCQDATRKKAKLDTTKQTQKGKMVINHLIEIFDKNIANDRLSRKECQKILKLAEPYMQASEVAPRIAVTSSKLYSK